MPKIDIKPLSVNDAWKGRRFKTDAYKAYERSVLLLLPKKADIPDGKIAIELTWGLSSKSGDIDNPIKCFVDCLQKKYDFNDNRIYDMHIKKVDVKKGDEFIEFSISPYHSVF